MRSEIFRWMLGPLLSAALLGAARAAEVELLRPVGQPPPPVPSGPDGTGRAVAIDGAALAALEVGDVVWLEPLPGRRIGYVLESSRAFVNGDVGRRGARREGDRIYGLTLVHNDRSALAHLSSPWGTFSFDGTRRADAVYVGRLTGPAEGIPFLADDDAMPPPPRARPAETVAQSAPDADVEVHTIIAPYSEVSGTGDPIDIAVVVSNRRPEPLAGATLAARGVLEHTELAAAPEDCRTADAEGGRTLECPLSDIAPGASAVVVYSVRVSWRADAAFEVSHELPGIPAVRSGDRLARVEHDALSDGDGDGMSDYNELVVGTDPGDPRSVLGPDAPSEVDLAFLYTPRFAAMSEEVAPETRINRLVVINNAYFADSDVPVSFRPVSYRMVDFAIGGDTAESYRRVYNAEGVFEGVPAMLEAAGADIVVLIDGLFESDADSCGRGTIGGERRNGRIPSDQPLVTLMYAPGPADPGYRCHELILAHELGHNLGLGHDRHDRTSMEGTFRWARGHGVEGMFHTIMARPEGFPGGTWISLFSSPENAACRGLPCGFPRDDPERGADAVSALRHTRFQVAARRDSLVLPHAGGGSSGAVMRGAATRTGEPGAPVSVFSPDDSIDMSVTIELPSNHRGETGMTHIVLALAGGERFYLDVNGAWLPWSGERETLGGLTPPRPLDAVERLVALDGFVPRTVNVTELEARVYFGYTVPSMDVVAYTPYGIDLIIEPEPAEP